MKKTLLALGLLLCAVPAFAQDTTVQDKPDRPVRMIDARVKEAREQMRANLEEDRDERKGIIEERKAIVEERETIKKEFKAELETFRAGVKEELKGADSVEERGAILKEAGFEKQALKQRAQDAREEFTGKVQGLFTERVSVGIRIFETHILRAETMRNRIAEGLDKLQDKGVNTDSVQTHLDLAATHIAAAKASVEEVKDALDSALTTESDDGVKALFEDAKTNFTEGRESLKSAFAELRLAVSEFKGLVKTNKPERPEEPTEETVAE